MTSLLQILSPAPTAPSDPANSGLVWGNPAPIGSPTPIMTPVSSPPFGRGFGLPLDNSGGSYDVLIPLASAFTGDDVSEIAAAQSSAASQALIQPPTQLSSTINSPVSTAVAAVKNQHGGLLFFAAAIGLYFFLKD